MLHLIRRISQKSGGSCSMMARLLCPVYPDASQTSVYQTIRTLPSLLAELTAIRDGLQALTPAIPRAPIGVDFALKVQEWNANTLIRLQSWDIADKSSPKSIGQERFGNMKRVYYKEAVGAFIVFDVTQSQTFGAVRKSDLDSKMQQPVGTSIPCVLLGNKCDMSKEGIVNNSSAMNEFCKENNFASWFLTSAKENLNIEEAARSLITQILHNQKEMNLGDSGQRCSGQRSMPLDGIPLLGQSVPRRTCC
ncbi:ras-related protein Rab-38-like [Haemaphysalis longicornis]